MDIEKFLKYVKCEICNSNEFAIIKKANYKNFSNYNDIINIYKSSSDHELFDQLVRCTECNLVYVNPRLRYEIIIKSYTEAIDPVFFSQNNLRIKTFKKFFLKWIKKNNINIDYKTKILDIGCAGGAFPKAVSDIGFNVIGVEPNMYLCEYGKKNYKLDLRQGTLNEQYFNEKEFNIITLFDVIEHLDKPGNILNKINKILDNTGLLIINYPDYNSWPCKLLKFKWPFFLNVHLYYFTPKTLNNLLKKHGFKIKHIQPYYQILELGYILDRAAKIIKIIRYISKLIKYIGLHKTPITYFIGQTLITAEKIK